MFRPLEYYTPADQLINLAYLCDYLEPDEKLERLQHTGKQIGGLLFDGWEQDQENTQHTLKALTAYACMPSLATTIQGRQQSKAIAKKVTKNMRVLYDCVLSSELVQPDTVEERKDAKEIFGQMSELAIIGTLWWGITNNQRDPNSSVLPATQTQDAGPFIDGYRTGYDIAIIDAHGSTQAVQVKGSLEEDEKIKSYREDIAILTPNMLTHKLGPFPAVHLLEALVNNDYTILRKANERAHYQISHNPFHPKNTSPQQRFYIPQSIPAAT